MAEWLFECGIGEDRAALVEGGRIVEAIVERPGLRAGSVVDARLTAILVPGRRGIATRDTGEEILIEPLPRVTEGAAVRVEILREAISEPGTPKRAKGRITDAGPVEGPDLATRIGAHIVVRPHGPDLLEEAGWSECLEQAARGAVAFPGGALRISTTPAMTLIDVDGALDLAALAVAGARAAGEAIRRFGIAGNIGIDLPTVGGKTQRAAVAEAFDAALPPPFERTAVNGFGFMQVIRPKARASLIEIIADDRAAAEARALLRVTARSAPPGAATIVARAAVMAVLRENPDWIAMLERHLGGPVTIANAT